MLFLSDEETRHLRELMSETQTGDPELAARRVIEYRPTFAPGWLALGAAAKDPQEALAAFWKALWLEPCRPQNYLALADFLTRRQEANAVAKHLRVLALWKLSFAEEIPPYIAENFESSLGAEARQPETYELMALAQEVEFAKSAEIPAIAERLRPYRLLNQLQRDAPDLLPADVLQEILQYKETCEPLLRNALREWARTEDALDDESVCLVLAILGEISGPDVIEELMELNNWQEDTVFAHVHWALYRLGQREPKAALEYYRTAAGGTLPSRCAIAEHILQMEQQPGDIAVLTSLVDGLEALPFEHDAVILLAAVAAAVTNRGDSALAVSLVSQYKGRIKKADWSVVEASLRGAYSTLLDDMDIAGKSLEEVCLERALMPEDEDEDEDEDEEALSEDELNEELDVAPPPKPGRNEPCWCGSGKKYKKCHLAADEETDRRKPDEPAKDNADATLHAVIMNRVFEASREWHKESDLKRAKKMYFGESGQIEATEDEINRFLQWLLHDFRDASTRRTAIENFLRTRESKLRPVERELLESLRDARFGLYEVERVEPGSGIQLHDLFAGDSRFVHDVSSSHTAHRWDCILLRLQFYEGRWIAAGDGILVPRNILDRMRDFVERESRKAKQDPAEFVRANSHRLHRVAHDLSDRNLAGLRIVNSEGEEVSFGKAEYQISDEAALLARLRSLEELEEGANDAADPAGPLWFTWLQPMGGQRRPLGHLEIENGELRLEAMSRTRLETLRGLVEFHAAGLIQHRGDHYTTVDEIKDRVRRGEAAPGPARRETAPPSDAEREMMEKVLKDHYAGWVNESLPALGGKTPRQAMRSRAGRESVIDLLRLMENGQQRKNEPGLAYDFNIIRRELGLPEE